MVILLKLQYVAISPESTNPQKYYRRNQTLFCVQEDTTLATPIDIPHKPKLSKLLSYPK